LTVKVTELFFSMRPATGAWLVIGKMES